MVVLAVYYPDALEAVKQHGSLLDGKVVVDISNPVNEDYSGLVDRPAGSAAEEIASAAPTGARVVKAFNTTFAPTLAEGEVEGQQLDVFIAGDDEEAKATVREFVESGDLRAIDAGPLASAQPAGERPAPGGRGLPPHQRPASPRHRLRQRPQGASVKRE